ncbi:MAG TPA: hypothetical protein VGJ60_31880 [Chloroflexota bacterium]
MHDFSPSLNRRQLLVGGAAVTAAAFLSNGIAAAQVAPPAWTPVAISVTDNGMTLSRTFLVHTPPAVPGQLLPAVIAYHGGGQNAAAMAQHWDSVRNLCVIVCPNALIRPGTGTTGWEYVRPTVPPAPPVVTVPTVDLAFTEAILNWLRGTGRVDMDRVYAAGFSSGGDFTWQLTQLSRSVDWFRGYAPVSAIVNTQMTALADPAALTRPKPLAYTMGTADYNWSRDPGSVQQPVPPDVVTAWIARNRTLDASPPVVYSCGRTAGPAPEARVDPFGVEQLYLPDPAVPNAAAIAFMTVVNGTHAWPLTGSDPTGRNLVTHDVDWTKRLISFWTTYAGMGIASPPAYTRC